MPRVFPVSFISEGRFWKAGDPIPDEIVKPFMLRYQAKDRTAKQQSLTFSLNQSYSLDSEGNRLPAPARQAAEMEREARLQEEYEQELLSQAESPSVRAAVEQLQQDHEADVEVQKRNLEYRAKLEKAADDLSREQEAERLAELEGLEPTKATVYGEDGEFAVGNSDSQPEPEGPRASVSPKPKAKAKPSKLYARRDGKFVLASTVNLIDGEALYRLRPRTFGKAQRYILHTTVNMKGK